jgi:hypothetical protein
MPDVPCHYALLSVGLITAGLLAMGLLATMLPGSHIVMAHVFKIHENERYIGENQKSCWPLLQLV